jgi:SET and MYND domain-containing protein
MGRGVFNVKEGTTDENIIIYREKPLVSQIRPKSRLACAYCLQTKLNPEDLKPLYEAQWDFMYKDQVEPHKWYDCEKCGSSPLAGERYCSESCRGAAKQKYHELLCPKSEWWSDTHPGEQIPHPIEAIWNLCSQGSPCLINPLLIARIMATVVNIIASNNGSQKSIDDALEPYKLFSAGEKPPKELASMTVVCVRAIYHAKYRSNPELLKVLDGVITEELYSELHGILTRNAHHLNPLSDFHIYLEGLSAFNQALLVSQYDEEMKPMDFVQTEWMKNLTVEGTGLFEITNSINHSCRPNSMVVHCNTDHTISVVSKVEITHGTEITISYIDETLPKAERQAKLKEFYNFECKCVKCLEES